MAENTDATSPSASDPDPPRAHGRHANPPTMGKRHRLRHWLLRIALVVLILVILLVVGVQIVLSTSLPRTIVLGQIEKELGLRATASSLSTGWFGHTTLRDVKLSLPLATQSVLDAPEMRVHTNWLLGIVLGGAKIKGLDLERPTINVWQNAGGQWNVSEVVELLGRTGGAKPAAEAAQQATPTQRPVMPRLVIDDATIVITNARRQSTTIEHLTIHGVPEGALVWRYDVSIPDHLSIKGKLVPGGDWRHEVAIQIDRPEVWIEPLVQRANLPAIHLDGQWTGRLQNGQPTGRLDFKESGAAGVTVNGALAVSSENGVWSVRPENVVVKSAPSPSAPTTAEAVQVARTLSMTATRPTVQQTTTAAMNADAKILEAGASGNAGGATTTPAPQPGGTASTAPATRAVNRAVVLRPVTMPATAPAFAYAPAAALATTQGAPATVPSATLPASVPSTTTQPSATAMAQPGLHLAAASGRITYDGKVIKADALRIIGAGGFAELNGQYTPAASAGNIDVAWSGISFPSPVTHSGELHATLTARLDGGPDLRAALVTQGKVGTSARRWDGKLKLSAAGPGWLDLSITLAAPKFDLVGKNTVNLDGLTAVARVRKDVISLDSLSLPGAPGGGGGAPAQLAGAPSLSAGRIASSSAEASGTGIPRSLSGNAWYRLDRPQWAMLLDGQGWPVAQLKGEPLAFHIDVRGDDGLTTLSNVTFGASDVVLTFIGDYDARRPQPVMVQATLRRQLAPPALRIIQEARDAQAIGGAPPQLVTGTLDGKATVAGWISPMRLTIDGALIGHDLAVQGRPLGEVRGHVLGGANGDLAQLHTSVALLGGQWNLRASYVFETDASTIELAVRDLPLAQVAAAGGQEGISGTLRDGKWVLYVPGLKADPRDMRLSGGLLVEKLSAGALQADTLQIGTTLEGGRIKIDPIEAHNGNGVFRTTLEDDLAHWRHIDVSPIQLKDWPALTSGAILTATGGSQRISIDLPDASAKELAARKLRISTRALWIDSAIALPQRLGPPMDVGTASMTLGMEGRIIDLRNVAARVLGADAFGYAVIDIDHPLLAAGDLRMEGFDAERLAIAFPQASALQSLRGSFNGTARLYPARAGEVVDALEPLVLDVTLNASRDARYGGAEIGNGRFRGFLNLDTHWGFLRGVLADSDVPPIPPSQRPGYPPCGEARTDPPPINTMYVAGGILHVWGRAMRVNDIRERPGSSELATHGRLSFKCVQLDQIVHAFDAKAPPTPGLLDGQVLMWGTTAVTTPAAPQRPPAATIAAAEANAKASREPGRAPAPATGPVIAAATAPTTGPFAPARATSGPVTLPAWFGTTMPSSVPSTLPHFVTATQPSATQPSGAPTSAPAAPHQATFVERFIANLYGEGAIDLHRSDLGNVDVIAFLYNAMHLGGGARGIPSGSGDVAFRIEKGTLNITRMHYFNRGVEVRVLGKVSDLQNAPDSPVSLSAVGSIRPLKNINLPLLPDLDKLLSVIQTGATSVSVDGTLKNHKTHLILFQDIGQGMREFLAGDISSSVQTSAGQ